MAGRAGRCLRCPDFHEDVSEMGAAWKRRKEVLSAALSDGTIASILPDNVDNIFSGEKSNIYKKKKNCEKASVAYISKRKTQNKMKAQRRVENKIINVVVLHTKFC